jgi:hypothetical protein
MPAAPSRQGVPDISEEDRPRDAPLFRPPLDPRQLRHTQDTSRATLAQASSALQAALHPDSSSWLNLVERLFAEITRQRIRRGTFHSVAQLETAILEWINHRNAHPKPFIWTAKAGPIILKYRRAKKALANLAAGCK